MTDSRTAQLDIAAFVSQRGYLDGYTRGQIIARQLVKQLEETCEALQAVTAEDTGLYGLAHLIRRASGIGDHARIIFDMPSQFDGVTVDFVAVNEELPDLVVPLAVLSQFMGVDMMTAGLAKAAADVKRGVRNGATVQPAA